MSTRVASNTRQLTGYHSPQVEVDVRLNTNESPLPPPEGWFDAVSRYVEELAPHRYPDRDVTVLRRRLAEMHGVGVENVWCANGSNEILQTLVLAYGGPEKNAVVFQPSYAMHAHIPRICGTNVITVDRADDFTVPVDSIELAGAQADIMFLCSPNNPTGTVETRTNIETAVRSARGITVVDEAYGQFADWSAIELVDEETPLAVTRTFSKTWAMAGLRLGYVVAPSWMIEDLQASTLPYHLSALTQAAGVAALDFEAEMNERIALIVSERQRVQQGLNALGLRSYPSGANFVLFQPGGAGADVWKRLVDHSVLVRDTGSWDGLAGSLRVTIGTAAENDAFLAALATSVGNAS